VQKKKRINDQTTRPAPALLPSFLYQGYLALSKPAPTTGDGYHHLLE